MIHVRSKYSLYLVHNMPRLHQSYSFKSCLYHYDWVLMFVQVYYQLISKQNTLRSCSSPGLIMGIYGMCFCKIKILTLTFPNRRKEESNTKQLKGIVRPLFSFCQVSLYKALLQWYLQKNDQWFDKRFCRKYSCICWAVATYKFIQQVRNIELRNTLIVRNELFLQQFSRH